MQSSRIASLFSGPAWEHRVVYVDTDTPSRLDEGPLLQAACNRMGSGGWELVSACRSTRGCWYQLFFKRLSRVDAMPDDGGP